MHTEQLPRYITTSELAALIRTPAETLRYWVHVGRGPASVKVGRRRLYAVEDVEAWLAEARRAGTAA